MKHNATVSIIKVTWQQAEEWLKAPFEGQRALRQNWVDKLAIDMIEDKFMLGPDAILRICEKLFNGQHRLSAQVKAKKNIWYIVMESQDPELYKVIDAGIKRSVSDACHIPWGTSISAATNIILGYDYKCITTTGLASGRFTRQHSIDYIQQHLEELTEQAKVADKMYRTLKFLSMPHILAFYHLAARSDAKDDIETFLAGVFGGINVGPGTPIELLRQRLIQNGLEKAKLGSKFKLALMVKAYLFTRTGRRVRTLKIVKGESFPRFDQPVQE